MTDGVYLCLLDRYDWLAFFTRIDLLSSLLLQFHENVFIQICMMCIIFRKKYDSCKTINLMIIFFGNARYNIPFAKHLVIRTAHPTSSKKQ